LLYCRAYISDACLSHSDSPQPVPSCRFLRGWGHSSQKPLLVGPTWTSLRLRRHRFSPIPISHVLTPHAQAGDAAAVPRLHSMLLLATDVLCVFNKPSGISVQGGTSTSAHMDAWAVAAHSASASWAMPLCPRLVHRLDKGACSHFSLAAIVADPLFRARIYGYMSCISHQCPQTPAVCL
jgi:hypothetical protein